MDITYMNDPQYLLWMESTTPDNVLSAESFFYALQAPDPVMEQRIQMMRAAALERHHLSEADFSRALQDSQIYACRWSRISPQLAQKMGFEPLDPMEPPDQKQGLPAFPTGALPPVLGEYVRAVAASIQVAEDMAASVVLGACAAAVQGRWMLEVKPDWTEPLNLYLLTVARPSERKSPVLREVTAPLYAFERAEQARRAPAIQEAQTQRAVLEKRIAFLSDKLSRGDAHPSKASPEAAQLAQARAQLNDIQEAVPYRLLADDTTPEAFLSLLACHGGRMALFSAEGGLFQILAGLYTSGQGANLDGFLKAYSGDPIRVDRKGRAGEQIDHPAATLMLMVQPQVLQQVSQNKVFSERGLLARFLYSLPASLVGQRAFDTPGIPPQVRQRYADCITRLLELSVKPGPAADLIRLGDQALAQSQAFYHKLERAIPGRLADIESWAGKFHGQVMRIAGILHCVICQEDAAAELVSGSTMASAIQIGRYFLAHSMWGLTAAGAAQSPLLQNAGYVWQHLSAGRQGSYTKSEVLRLCRRLDSEQITAPLEELIRRGYLRKAVEPPLAGTRPVTRYWLNPEALWPPARA